MKHQLIAACLFLFSIPGISQIAIRQEVQNKPVVVPPRFDSLSNIHVHKEPVNYKQYVGYQLFYLPKSSNFKSNSTTTKTVKNLYTLKPYVFTKPGKIPLSEVSKYRYYTENIDELTGTTLEAYNKAKAEYEQIDKEETSVYSPIFYHKKTSKTDGRIYGQIGTDPSAVEGQYFTILDIKGKEDQDAKEFIDLADLDINPNGYRLVSLEVLLLNESNGDSLKWVVNQARHFGEPFFLVPYYEKLRARFLSEKLMLESNDITYPETQNLVDVNNGNVTSIKYGEVWECTDISFVNTDDNYHIKPFIFLKNGDQEVKLSADSEDFTQYFITKEEFDHREAVRKQNELERKKAAEAKRLQAQKAKEARKKRCIEKWGEDKGMMIYNRKVQIGMNKEMCTEAWGRPIKVNSTIVSGLTSEQWVYGLGTYLYFDNGKLKAIQN